MDLVEDKTTCPNSLNDGLLTEISFLEKTWNDDFALIVESRKLYTAKAVLACVSPVFKTMFKSEFKEKYQDEMELSDKKFDDVLEFLHCVCPGKQTDICDENVYRLIPLAEEYQVSYLKSRCEDFLIKSINDKTSADDLYQMLHLALVYHMDRLRAECVAETSKKSVEDLDKALKSMSIPFETVCVIQNKMLRRLENSGKENNCLKAVNKYLLNEINEEVRRKIQTGEGWEGILFEFEIETADLEAGCTLSKEFEFKMFDSDAKFKIAKNAFILNALKLELSFDMKKLSGCEILVLGRVVIKNSTKKDKDVSEKFQMVCRNECTSIPNSMQISKLRNIEEGYVYHGKMAAEVHILAGKKYI